MSASSTDHPVLARLLSSNAQWAQDVSSAEPDFFAQTAKGQSPKVLWIGCADSRVPESVVLACKPGDVFVHRNIANQFPPSDDAALAVLAYAVDHLAVEHVVVVGHSACGGAAACLAAAQHPPAPPTTPLQRWLAPLTRLAASPAIAAQPAPAAIAALVDANVKEQVANVLATDTVIRAWAAGKPVYVHGWVYLLEEGRLRDLCVSQGPPPS